ncbi:DUF1764 domain-containing protein [Hamiltosporidium tvaerminnensis]|uniref:DUF1764 domain-containing protein n=2 Tax=Hamiltosporidium TaxID=1176354 RepID=A0A4Q9M2X6_9MICR|nr:DUF1764 domain-containing protein [Hamiltosporidium tvaerminnensis]TBU07097.1 DUF1764 domain-containing protein [Hamiltosporidium magnivora]TBU20368.1 DUF1764 domain-containing protein [Hamiltosporidium tvaerminnensis]
MSEIDEIFKSVNKNKKENSKKAVNKKEFKQKTVEVENNKNKFKKPKKNESKLFNESSGITDKTQKEKKKNYKKQKDSENSNEDQNKSRFTSEGLPLLSEEALHIGKGGKSKLCPFDCDCCF